MHTPCRLRITLTTNRQVPKWFCSRGCCAHQVVNFCGAPLSIKPPRLLPLSSVILLGNSTTPLAVLYRARPDIIEPACHRPTCCYSIIERTCLGCRRLISRGGAMKADSVCRCNGGGGEGRLPILHGHGHCRHCSRGCLSLFLSTTVVGGMTTTAITAAARGVE